MKRSKNLIILAVVFVLLLGSYVYISKRPPKEEDATDTGKIELLKFDVEKVKKMTLKSKEGSLVFERSGESWIVPGQPDAKLNKSSVDSIAYSLGGLNADKVISDKQENLESYGLKTPSAEATALLDDGTQKTVYVGDTVPGNTGYYATLEGDTKVYVIPYADGNHFLYTLADVRETALLSEIDPAAINYMKLVYRDGQTVELKLSSKSVPDEQDFNEGVWLLKQVYKNVYAADTENTSKLASSIAAVKISEVIEDNTSDFAKYGLDKPSLELTVKTTTQTGAENTSGSDTKTETKTVNETREYIFGNDKDDSHVYFKLKDSNAVYTADKSAVEALNANTFDLVDKFAYIVFIDNVDSIVIEGEGKRHEMTLTRTPKANTETEAKTDGETGEDAFDIVYKVDGKEMESDAFKKLYQEVIGLIIDAENDKTVPDNAEFKITFNLNKGSQKQQITTYSTYNNDFYAVFRNGNSDFLIAKEKVKKMLDKVQEAANK